MLLDDDFHIQKDDCTFSTWWYFSLIPLLSCVCSNGTRLWHLRDMHACVCTSTVVETSVYMQVACSFIPTVACIHIHWLARRAERERERGQWMQQFWKSVWLGSNSCHGFKKLPWKHKLPIKWIWMQSLQGEMGWREEKGKVRLNERESAPPDCVPQ